MTSESIFVLNYSPWHQSKVWHVLRVCSSLNLSVAAAAATCWTAREHKGPWALPKGGWRVGDGEAGEGRRLVSVLAPSPHVRLTITRSQNLGVCSSAPVFRGTDCSPTPGLWGSVHHLPIPGGLLPCQSPLRGLGIPLRSLGLWPHSRPQGIMLLYFYFCIFFSTGGGVTCFQLERLHPCHNGSRTDSCLDLAS